MSEASLGKLEWISKALVLGLRQVGWMKRSSEAKSWRENTAGRKKKKIMAGRRSPSKGTSW